jgi:uncharacterized protein YggE
MSIRNILLAGLLAVATLPVATALADEPAPRTVSVTGQGEVSAEPDLAQVTLGVQARRPTMAEARKEVAATVDRVLALCKDLKIDPRHVNATRVQVQPDYSWDDRNRKQVLLGYVVSRQVQVELRDLEQLGPLIERAVSAGVNQVSDPQLDSTQRKQLERQALTLAVQDARLNAETLAQAAGVGLGAVRTISASGAAPVIPMYRAKIVMADVAAAPPAPEGSYEAGEMKFSASVSAEYDLVVTR